MRAANMGDLILFILAAFANSDMRLERVTRSKLV